MSQDMAVFKGGVAVITGAGSGIGEGLARLAAKQGMRVVLADVAMERTERVAQEIRAGGTDVLVVHTDVAEPEALDRLAAITHETFGDVTLLVNNAGIETLGYVWELPAALWEKTLNININGVIHGVRAFAPGMLASGKRAWIANTSSIGGLGIMPIQTSYVLSKHAVLSFSECLYLEMQMKRAPIHVSAILPGPVATRIFEDSKTAEDPMNANHGQIMHNMLASEGISGDEAAERILPQIAAGKFWVSTHPEVTREFANNRASHLSNLADPALPAELLAGMGLG
ncbi:short-chain dehydrogenase [Kineobactrum sediminis]|uniref:Short-chain dehydrogenase n=1 Tax=Kineobactrum sediminis TaxID=1905677 RepID=A0A2N5Y285_9GAMM|nr:SDR family NAD(P)-dependent oxidoreductase [Kineobactrum sediminis]PLW82502.1 short-chain dehydrogenase [Kineobactrum sediminis]